MGRGITYPVIAGFAEVLHLVDDFEIRVEGGVLFLGIEARTVLCAVQEVVTNNLGIRIGLLQLLEQVPEGGLLLGSTGVGIATVSVLATDVANANGMLVVAYDMGTGKLLGTAGMNAAILIDDPVVATAWPPFLAVPVVKVLDCDLTAELGGGAMDDNPLDILHGVQMHFHTCLE